MDEIELAAAIEAYDPKLSPDNRADELDLHRSVVVLTGIGTMNPDFERTFLRSLDAAMTLVPEGWVFTVGHWVASDHLPAYFADCADIASVKAHDGYDAIQGRAATPALALVAAALRARAAS